MINVGLIGYGKAGKAVAQVLASTPGISLRWIARRTPTCEVASCEITHVPIWGMQSDTLEHWLKADPVDALVDFSTPESVYMYGEQVRQRNLMLVTAISAYPQETLAYLTQIGLEARVMSSPNITLGINFLILAAKLLRSIAPFADVEIVEQHFREKPEISGTARKIAEQLDVEGDRITSLRLGGIVGHHEVIFGFPNQTVRLTHESIRREAFGTGAVFALQELATLPIGFYTFEELLLQKMRQELLKP